MTAFDFVAAIERAYDTTKDDPTWLQDLTRLIAPAFGEEQAITSFCFELEHNEALVGETVSVGQKAHTRQHYLKLHEIGRECISTSKVYEGEVFTLLSRVVDATQTVNALRAAGMTGEDILGLRANMTPDRGLLITSSVRAGYRIKNRNLWTRFAAHLGSALRLRQTRCTPKAAAAVLSPRGKLEHGSERAIAAREDLAAAAIGMDRARGKLRRIDQDAASQLWQVLVTGEWSLVDWLDHDGKRFLLAQENAIPVGVQKSLTRRERQVVACAAMGHSNKLIAYDLGLSTGTVSVFLTRAAKKLGVSGRVALIRAFREGRA